MVIQIGKYRSESGDLAEILEQMEKDIGSMYRKSFIGLPVSRPCFYMWKTRKTNPTVENISKLALFLDKKIDL